MEYLPVRMEYLAGLMEYLAGLMDYLRRQVLHLARRMGHLDGPMESFSREEWPTRTRSWRSGSATASRRA